jgi:hypothetical protein
VDGFCDWGSTLLRAGSPLAGIKCPAINPPENAPASRMTAMKKPRIVLTFIFTMPPIDIRHQGYYVVIRE